MRFADLSKDIRVAQYHEDGSISFVQPTALYDCPFSGEMVSFTTSGHGYVDLVVTPNHRMVALDHKGLRLFEAASEKRSDKYTQNNKIIVSGTASGNDTLTPLERIAIAFQADGSYPSRSEKYTGKRSGKIPVRFSLKKQRKKDRLESLCRDAGVDFTRTDYENGCSHFWIRMPHRLSKTFDWVSLDHSAEWAEAFLEELSHWDGKVNPQRLNNISYSSSIELNVDVVQAIAVLCGRRGQKSIYKDPRGDRLDQYTINISKKYTVGGQSVVRSRYPYNGRVYCASVPTKMLIVRRNGSIAVCGNTEHSVMTALGEDGEEDVVRRLLETYPTGILSVVADSYDYYHFVSECVGSLFYDDIIRRDGVFVVRPDSVTPEHPTPESLILWTLETLWGHYGGVTNEQGFKVLNPHVRILWGDGIDAAGIERILDEACNHGFAASNLVFGMGGGLLQKVNRDTQRFAFKSSAQKRDGVWHDVFKKPLSLDKASKPGRLSLIPFDGGVTTVAEPDHHDDLLREVFKDGVMLNMSTFDEVRSRAAVSMPSVV